MISIGNAQQLSRRLRVALSAALLLGALCVGASGARAQHKGQSRQIEPAVAESASQQAAAPAARPGLTQQQQADAIARAQKVQALIGRAENSYNSGVANYNANRLEAARADFDNAVDAMLSSGLDLKNDPQLSDEFEHLVDAINSLELVALKQGNGFSPKVEPAPLDEAMNEVTFPPDPALVGRINAELQNTKSDLPLVVNDYVAGFINYFTNSPGGHAHLRASLERAGKYKEMISKTLKQYGVPQDLIYQAVAESGFQPQALNRRSGAGGMWQFMPFAGAYGLERNGFFDERFDPEKSTIAYAKYMKYLYAQFGDWYLAMAAYDWGAGNVQRAVARTGYADFWQLYRHNALPGETKNYVPGILAAVIMAKNPKQYGLTDVVPDAPVVSDTVTTEYSISLQLAADVTNSSVAEIVALNPALLRLTTPRDIPYDLHLPSGTRQMYMDRVKDIPEEDRASWRFHIVKSGETLNDIATSLHSKASEIAAVNEIPAGDPPGAGDELVVPVATAAGRAQRYVAHRGDTLVTVADRFGVGVEDLRAWNHLSSNKLTPGRSLYVAEPVRLAPTARTRASRGHATSAHGRAASGRAASGRTTSSHPTRATPASSHPKTKTVRKQGSTGR
ncbi:MAG TPA: transglycosylase SLT domain-containing protein [Acidobacteriaceae bacterium]|nr:transglycosylase SLT domain-containing protein [Acidobacteriaceae bacterium]